MTESATSQRSAAMLRTLQAVRLAGMADLDELSDRALLPEEYLSSLLDDAVGRGLIERGGFADLQGWLMTEAGHTELARMLNAEVTSHGAGPQLGAALERFEEVNAPFVEVVSRWQLRSTSDEQDGADVIALLATLSDLGGQLSDMLSELVPLLPRFGRYPAQYRLALQRAGSEGSRWISGLGIHSCHVVWAELHQDLLSTAGRRREDPVRPV